ncbi:oxidoreductase [Mycolicibacterium goodii]|uniref:SDR family NAD(P)-dependent oxidoreductase n=1 Tax=Mycolicibacterium goodii TaxID=134601 RepID=A0ABS6HNE6_MYCGD|nr:oxidoreductase [Mycolicibacterium goodii]MBU8823811.1 SDR family NAD(P)-dependent oxidoreductase [Mycolicibacterium goodii]MBU8841628.1 SDR family NAD(P)-dependent oxidoreductase [Mycolicibacterium goodii]OKH65456.1 short-chain dehydrogenase [Mycobacterium sp. SWH-M5]PJK19605.1 short-chain dehydrogenase/reductase [Mycolicibacterium goodii]
MATWFITGASRGFGALIAETALAAGHNVVATARDAAAARAALPGGERLLTAALDVGDADQAHAAVSRALETFGGIDVLVNNAGRGILGAVEEVSDSEARAVFETNVFGVLNVTRAVLPGMRERRTGHILNFSSVGGFAGSAGWGVYNGTKFAVEGISEALALELAPLGIQVTIVEPGYFRTDFLDGSSLHFAANALADYAETAGQMRDRAQTVSHQQPGDPRAGARVIVDIGGRPDAPLRLPLGADAVERIEAKLKSVAVNLDQVRGQATSTSYAG